MDGSRVLGGLEYLFERVTSAKASTDILLVYGMLERLGVDLLMAAYCAGLKVSVGLKMKTLRRRAGLDKE